MKNWRQTILSQYDQSPRLVTLLDAINQWFSLDESFELFYDQVWNIDTAIGWGLDNWGRILVLPRVVTLSGFGYFGFGEAGDRVGFGQGPFGDFYKTASSNFTLTDDVYRQYLLAKAAFNITDGSIPAINSILMNILFVGRGNAYVVDGGASAPPVSTFGFYEAGDRVGFGQGPFGDEYSYNSTLMTLTYTFEFPLQQFEVAMVESGVLPKPPGVTAFWNFSGGVI